MKSRHTLEDGYLDKSYVLSVDHENSPDHCYESLWSNYYYETYVHTNGRELLSEYLAECNPDKLGYLETIYILVERLKLCHATGMIQSLWKFCQNIFSETLSQR